MCSWNVTISLRNVIKNVPIPIPKNWMNWYSKISPSGQLLAFLVVNSSYCWFCQVIIPLLKVLSWPPRLQCGDSFTQNDLYANLNLGKRIWLFCDEAKAMVLILSYYTANQWLVSIQRSCLLLWDLAYKANEETDLVNHTMFPGCNYKSFPNSAYPSANVVNCS